MSNLQLVTTETFGEIDCNFYRNMNDDILLTREQIGSALEYANPQKAIDNIHSKHKERLDKFSTTLKTRGKTGQEYPATFYTTKGVMEICRHSKQPKANAFIDFCWEVMDKLFHNQPIQQLDLSHITSVITSLQNDMQYMKYQLSQHNNQQHINKPVRKYSKWKSKTNPKLKLLAEHLSVNQMTVLRNIYIKLEDTYNLDLSDYQEDYCFEMGVDTCSQFDVIEHDKELRDKFDIILISLLTRYEIKEDTDIYTDARKTIFDN